MEEGKDFAAVVASHGNNSVFTFKVLSVQKFCKKIITASYLEAGSE